jgi:hypothetical protein
MEPTRPWPDPETLDHRPERNGEINSTESDSSGESDEL